MSRRPTSSLPHAPVPDSAQHLPLGMAQVVRLSFEGSDLGAVEAAAAELKVRLGARFAITGRRLTTGRDRLRISACMMANLDTVLDAEGLRQWAVPERWDTHLAEDGAGAESEGGEEEHGTGNAGAAEDAPLTSMDPV